MNKLVEGDVLYQGTCFRVDFESVSLFASLLSATLVVLKCILCNWDL